MLPDMALPLKRSASSLSIEAGPQRKPLILLNPRNVQELTEKKLDTQLERFVVHVKSYDRDRGVGKVTSTSFDRPLNFIVAPADQERLKPLILEAMEKDVVLFHCNTFQDKSNQITSLFLRDISEPDKDSAKSLVTDTPDHLLRQTRPRVQQCLAFARQAEMADDGDHQAEATHGEDRQILCHCSLSIRSRRLLPTR